MSLFRRKLLAKRGGGDSRNLATVTDGGIVTIEQGITKNAGLLAKFEAGKFYNIKFEIDMDITKRIDGQPAWSYFLRFGSYSFWKNPAAFVKLTAPVGHRHWAVDSKKVQCYSSSDGISANGLLAFQMIPNNIISGTFHCYNLEVYEA